MVNETDEQLKARLIKESEANKVEAEKIGSEFKTLEGGDVKEMGDKYSEETINQTKAMQNKVAGASNQDFSTKAKLKLFKTPTQYLSAKGTSFDDASFPDLFSMSIQYGKAFTVGSEEVSAYPMEENGVGLRYIKNPSSYQLKCQNIDNNCNEETLDTYVNEVIQGKTPIDLHDDFKNGYIGMFLNQLSEISGIGGKIVNKIRDGAKPPCKTVKVQIRKPNFIMGDMYDPKKPFKVEYKKANLSINRIKELVEKCGQQSTKFGACIRSVADEEIKNEDVLNYKKLSELCPKTDPASLIKNPTGKKGKKLNSEGDWAEGFSNASEMTLNVQKITMSVLVLYILYCILKK